MTAQAVIERLPRFLRRHKVVRALSVLDPVQPIRFNDGALAFPAPMTPPG